MPLEITPADYFDIDQASEVRHELVFGRIVKVPGSSPRHSHITANVCIALGKRLAGSNCRVYDSSLRVCLDRETGIYVYPDLTVVEGTVECLENRDETLANPKLVVEVLSPASLDFDLGSKARLYTKVSSLTDLLIIDQDRIGVEHWVRSVDGHWDVVLLKDANDVLKLESLKCEVPVAEIYSSIENL
jgi:Uma2 family endonuclease